MGPADDCDDADAQIFTGNPELCESTDIFHNIFVWAYQTDIVMQGANGADNRFRNNIIVTKSGAQVASIPPNSASL